MVLLAGVQSLRVVGFSLGQGVCALLLLLLVVVVSLARRNEGERQFKLIQMGRSEQQFNHQPETLCLSAPVAA